MASLGTPGATGPAPTGTPGWLQEAGRQIEISPGANGTIDLTDGTGRMPPRPATIMVQAWPAKSRKATVLELAMAEGTVDDFEAKLVEMGLREGYRLYQLHGDKLEPQPTTYRTVMALLPSRRSAGGGARPSSERREPTKLLVSKPPSFDMLSKVIAPEFTAAQGIKEILDNAIQSLVFFSMDHPELLASGCWTPQLVILIDLARGRLRVVDNGGGLNPTQMEDWAECGNSTNRSRVNEMLEAAAARSSTDPRVAGLFSQLFSSYGIGGKGGGGALTREGKEIQGNITLFSSQGPFEDDRTCLQQINFDLREAQRRQAAKDNSPWNREYICEEWEPETEKELRQLMDRDGWGDRITCLEVDRLAPSVVEKLREAVADPHRSELVGEIVDTWAYSFEPRLYEAVARDCNTFNREKDPPPLRITASVEACGIDGGAADPTSLNALAGLKYQKLASQAASSSSQPLRRGLRAGGASDAEVFCYEFDVTDGAGKRGRALLLLRYYPIKDGGETLPAECKAGFDVRWQSRLLKDERLRLLSFMDPAELSTKGRGSAQKELSLLLQRVGHRLHGELLLDPSFAVNKMKSQLLQSGEESSSGSIKLVQMLRDRKVAEWVRPGGGTLVDEFLQWLRGREQLDDNFRFAPNSERGDVEAWPPAMEDGASPPQLLHGVSGDVLRLTGYVTKILRAGDKTLTAPRSESGRPVEADALRLWLRKDKSKVFNKTTNAVWAEVYGFYFFARSGLSAVEVEEECRRATDGEVLYLEAGARAKAASLTGDAKEKALMLRALPLELIELKQSSLRIPEKDWKAHVRSLQDAHEKTKPSAVVCIDTATADATAAGSSFVGGDIERDVPIEYACEGFIDEGKKLWLAVQVHNGSNKVISKTELEKGGYVVKLTATHTEGQVKLIEASHFYAGGAAWLQPKLDEPGEWVCSIAVVDKNGATVGKTWAVTIPVAQPEKCASIEVEFEDEDAMLRVGEALPPLVVTAFDCVGVQFELSALPDNLDVDIVDKKSQGQRLELDPFDQQQAVLADGKIRIYNLVVRGPFATGKHAGSVKLGVAFGELKAAKTKWLEIKCGRPANLLLENTEVLFDAAPYDAGDSLPPMRLFCTDVHGNPAGGCSVWLEMSHDGEAGSDPFTGPSGPFETNAKGELVLGGGKKAGFKVNGAVLRPDAEAVATLKFVATLEAEDEAEDAVLEVPVRLAQLEQEEEPELATLAMSVVPGPAGSSTPTVGCDEEFKIELYGSDEVGNACRLDPADYAKPYLASSGGLGATWGDWKLNGDVLEMTVQLSGKAGDIEIELPESDAHRHIHCEPLKLSLVAGAPNAVVASVVGNPINGAELVVSAHLVDEHENVVESHGSVVEWEPLKAEDPDQLHVHCSGSGKKKGVRAQLKATVLAKQTLREPDEFGLVLSARFKKGGVWQTVTTESVDADPFRVTLQPGAAVISDLVVSRVQLENEASDTTNDYVDDDVEARPTHEVPKVTQPLVPLPPQPLHLTAEPSGMLPRLALRVRFEDGGFLEHPTKCQLRARLVRSGASAEARTARRQQQPALFWPSSGDWQKRAGGPVELSPPGEAPVQGLLLQEVPAPAEPGAYSLELALSFGSTTKGLPPSQLLKSAERTEVTAAFAIVVEAGPPSKLLPALPGASSAGSGSTTAPLKVVANEATELGTFARLVDAMSNRLPSDGTVRLSLRQYAMGSEEGQGITLEIAQPDTTLRLVDGELSAPALALRGAGPSGRYQLCFELESDAQVSGWLAVDYENPADEGEREAERHRQAERLQAAQARLQAAEEEEGELARRQKACAGQVGAARRAHDCASAEVRRSQALLAQKRSSRDAFGLDEAAVKRLKTAHGIGDADAASASATGAMPPNTLGQKLRAKVAQLEESLTVRVSVDGEEAERRRFGDFPIPLEPDDNSRVWLELRPRSDADGAQGPHGIFKVYSRGGEEHAEGPVDEQTLSPDPEGEYLLDALQPAVESGRVESLFESGRVADERLSNILAALLPSWFGADCVVLARPPAAAPPPPSFFARLKAKHLNPLASPPPALLPPPPAAAAAPPEEDADSGLLKLGPGGSLHPPFDGASFLVNRICCDGTAARTAWYRALGGYGDAIVFDKSSAMIDSDAPASSLLVALEDDAGLVGGGGGGYAVRSSDGGMGALAKPASSACRLGRLTDADEEQALSGTAEGRRVVEFERAASELSELERAGREAEEEEASAERAWREAECDLRLLEQELDPLRHEVEQLQQQLGVGGTGTGGGRVRGRKRARQGVA